MLRDIISTYRQAFRVYMRQRTRPRTIEESENKRLFYSKLYAVSALVTFCVATYITYVKEINFKYSKDVPREDDVIQKLSFGPTTVYRYRNFEKVGEVFYPGKENKNEPIQTVANSTSVETFKEK